MNLRSAYLVDAVRTPIARYRGALANVRPDDLAAHVVTALGARQEALYARVDHVVFGATNQAGEDNRNVARMAVLLSGLPFEVAAQKKAAAATEVNASDKEIVGVRVAQKKGVPRLFKKDESPGADPTPDSLSKPPAAFRKGGSVTAGNSSPVNDGASAVMIV